MTATSPASDLRFPASANESEVLIRVEGASKIFCRDLKKSLIYGLQDSARDLLSWGKKSEIRDQRSASSDDSSSTSDLRPQNSSSSFRALRDGEFLAVDNVSFELRRGECLGLIGRNGAGKTTLLKMLNGLIKPDAGRIEMRGRVGALIALGAGFNPILSGRENVYVNGSILGLTKAEIDAKIDDIIDFAEIGEFIDAPVQSYSSGMQVRLGFAVATAMEPDVLILDEVLAVGDMAFQAKCFQRIGHIRQTGAAILFVSHNIHQMSMVCDHGLLIENGRAIETGSIRDVLENYEARNRPTISKEEAATWSIPSYTIKLLRICGSFNGPDRLCIHPHTPFTLEFEVNNKSGMPEDIVVDTRIEDSFGTLSQRSSNISNMRLEKGENQLIIKYGGIARQDEQLKINVALWSRSHKSILAWSRGHQLFVLRSPDIGGREACEISFILSSC